MKQAWFVGILLLVLGSGAQAAETEAELDTRVSHYYATYTINPDATHVETHEWTTKILHERAVDGYKHYSFSYSTSIQKAEILHAYTLKADGRRIEVPKTNYQLKVNSGKDKHAPVFSDYTTLSVVFPDLAVGDTIAIAYKITQTEAMFPGQISITNNFSRLYAHDDVKITVDAPIALGAQYQARQMKEVRSEKDGRLMLQWTYENKQPPKSKRRDWSVYDVEADPGFSFSTFKSYAAIADAYGLRAREKAVVTEPIQTLANQITQDKKGVREQARALYEWVATNITYAGNCIGVGAVVPHDITFILENRMGDCKDHATLLQALLRAKGIASTQALVNASSLYHLPKIPLVSSVNHVINYIPELNLYVDSTSQTTPFGMLPFSVIGKPVLLVDGYKEGLKTPVPPIGSNRQHMKSVVKIDAKGMARGEIAFSLKGSFAENTRARVRHYSKTQIEESVENVLRGMNLSGSGKITQDDPKALLDTFNFKVNFEVKELVALPGPAAMFIYPLFPSDAPVHHYVSNANAPAETVDTACWSGATTEEYIYHLPKNMKILSLPDDARVANDFLTYQATYRLKGNTLTVKRTVDDRTPGIICSPEMDAAYQKFAAQAAKNLRAQVIYK